MAGSEAVRFTDVSFQYGDRTILSGVNLAVRAGEAVALMGSNGSGKSTLLKLACGLLLPETGTIRIFDHTTIEEGGYPARKQCGFVFQNPDDQLVASIVENEVAFGPENLGLPREEIRERITWALESVGLSGFEQRQTHTLSGGQKQRLALAGALAMRPRVLLLDEPSSMLDPESRYEFMRLVRELANGGMTVIIATHSPREAALADRVIRLEHGQIVFSGSPIDDELDLSSEMVRVTTPATEEIEDTTEEVDNIMPVLQFDNVTYRYDDGEEDPIIALDDVSFTLQIGEFVAIVGNTGSGKSTLVEHMNGLLHPTSGRVLSRWTDLADKYAANEARFRIGLVFQYPEQQLFASTVYDDIAFGPRNMELDPEEVEHRVRLSLEQVGLDFDELNARSPFQLSGGQQRRVAIAGVLAMQPDVLVMDEPCAGLDPQAHVEMRRLLKSMHAAGQTIVMVSHDKDDVAELATRIIRIDKGRVSPA